jgi:hypothetical protein
MFAPDLDGEQLAQILAEGSFELIPASALHPSGIPYAEAFSAALRYWTMPYRGRTGRMRRFVLTASHETLGLHPIVAGILELGDEAPFCTWRDDLLGLSVASLLQWIALDPKKNARLAAKRLRSIRKCLRPRSRGRSIGGSEDGGELLKDRKRLIYALRLAQGEFGLHPVWMTPA